MTTDTKVAIHKSWGDVKISLVSKFNFCGDFLTLHRNILVSVN